MIIVEGPDGAGKTTLVNSLTKDLGLTIGKRGTEDRDKLYEVTRPDSYKALAAAVGGHEPVRVWDRLFYSDFVYSPVQNRPCEFTPQEFRLVSDLIAALTAPLILCYPPYEVVEENARKGHQMEGVLDNTKRIYEHYYELMHTLPWILWYDYTQIEPPVLNKFVSYDDIVQRCVSYMALKRERAW